MAVDWLSGKEGKGRRKDTRRLSSITRMPYVHVHVCTVMSEGEGEGEGGAADADANANADVAEQCQSVLYMSVHVLLSLCSRKCPASSNLQQPPATSPPRQRCSACALLFFCHRSSLEDSRCSHKQRIGKGSKQPKTDQKKTYARIIVDNRS